MENRWDSEKLYFDGDVYYHDLINAIAQAKDTVWLETYIFAVDAIGERFNEALSSAANRGIKVRLLVDGIGAAAWVTRDAARLEKGGLSIRVYHPVNLGKLFKFAELTKLSTGLSRLNRRDHRKMVLIDGTSAWIGSLNIAASHSQEFSGASSWRDTAVHVTGDAVLDLVSGFEHAWIRSHTSSGKRIWRESIFPLRRRRTLRSPLVRMNFTLQLRRKNFRGFIRRINEAEQRVWITNAYLAPSRPLIRALTEAAGRGVDVRVLVPRTSDVFFMPWVATAHYGQLLKGGVRVFEYIPRFLHAKSVLVDSWSVVGTSNLNRRSLFKDFEVDVVLVATSSVTELADQFERDLKQSEEIQSAPGGIAAWIGRQLIYWFKTWI